jgi:hypothetical protein
MAFFGLPGGAELWVIFVVLVFNVLPGWAMYRVARRVGYSPSGQLGWAVAYVFLAWIALLAFAWADWPSRSEAAAGTIVSA